MNQESISPLIPIKIVKYAKLVVESVEVMISYLGGVVISHAIHALQTMPIRHQLTNVLKIIATQVNTLTQHR